MKIAPGLLNLKFDKGIQLTSRYTNTHFIFDPWVSDISEEEFDTELQGTLGLQDTKERIRRDIETIF